MLAVPVSVMDKAAVFGFRLTVCHSLVVFPEVRRIIVSLIRQKPAYLKIDMFISRCCRTRAKVAKGSVRHTARNKELCFTLPSSRAKR